MVSPAFAVLLRDRRTHYNKQIAAARSRAPAFDTDSFSSFIRDVVDPLWTALREAEPDRADSNADALLDMAVTLTEHRWVGASQRSPIVEQLWGQVAPGLAAVLARGPVESLGALTNAAIKLAQERGIRPAAWLDLVGGVGARVGDARQLRKLAVIAAWRAGAAHVRLAALEAGQELPPEIACAAMGVSEDANWPDIAQRLKAERWWAPEGCAALSEHRVGGFVGLGGPFVEPPRVRVHGADFLVTSGDRVFRLTADAFGATVRPSVVEVEDGRRSDGDGAGRLAGTQLQADDRTIELGGPSEGLRIAESADTLAVSSPLSHVIRLFPKVLA